MGAGAFGEDCSLAGGPQHCRNQAATLLLFEGIEIVARKSASVSGSSTAAADGGSWKRVGVVPGIELHLRGDMPKPKPAALKQIIDLLESALRKNL